MNKITLNDNVVKSNVKESIQYINFYSDIAPGAAGIQSSIDAAVASRWNFPGFILEVKRDSNGDFTLTKVKEFV